MTSENIGAATNKVPPFFKKHRLIIVSFVCWIMFFHILMEIGWLYMLIAMALLIPALVLSIFFAPSTKTRFIPKVIWTGAASLVFLFTVPTWLSYPLSNSYTYYIGMDVETPQGLSTCKSMIQYTNNSYPFWPGQYNRRLSRVRGEAIYCDLGEGRNLIAILGFEKDRGGHRTLKRLPWIAANYSGDLGKKYLPFYEERYDLHKDYIPILITLKDLNNPYSMSRVYPDKLDETFSNGFSIKRVWIQMTKEPYTSSDIQQHITWAGRPPYSKPFWEIDLRGVSMPFQK